MNKYLSAALFILMLAVAPSGVFAQSPLDPTFGTNGISVLDSVDAFAAVDMDLQDDNKILILMNGNCGHGFLCRLTPGGKLDPAFIASPSYRTYPVFHPGVFEIQGHSCNPNMDHVMQLKSKKILLALSPIAIIQLNTDGSIDNSFGGNGYTTIENDADPNTIRNIMDLKDVGNGVLFCGSSFPPPVQDTVAFARMAYNGSLDNTFGTNGYIRAPLPVAQVGTSSQILCSKILPNNKVLVGGSCLSSTSNTWRDIFLAMYNTNGTLDNTFGKAGVRIININNSNDDITTISYRDNSNIYIMGTSGEQRFVSKINSAGKTDSTFGTNGIVMFPHVYHNINTLFTGVVTPGNVIYAAADTGTAQKSNYLSYMSNGSLNTNFAPAGYFSTGVADKSGKLMVQPDGKIISFGSNGLHPKLLRFNATSATGVPVVAVAEQPQVWADGRSCYVSFPASAAGPDPAFSLGILSIDGKVIRSYAASDFTAAGTGAYRVALPSDLPAGMYVLHVRSSAGERTERISILK